MHLLYLDDSGSAENENDPYIVLAGISVYEAQVHWLTQELDKVAESFDPDNPHNIEFHASDMFQGRVDPWKAMGKPDRRNVINSVLKVIQGSYESARLFACAVHKQSFPDQDPMEMAFEDLCSRFDQYLKKTSKGSERQRGMVILDKSSYETTLQGLARNFRTLGTQWGVISTLADTPMFMDSRASRLIQVADHVAYAVNRRYTTGDTSFFDQIVSRFDSQDGIIHGLAHKQKIDMNCMCPACLSRRAQGGAH